MIFHRIICELNSLIMSFKTLVLVFQILTGTFLAFYFTADRSMAFSTVEYLMLEVNFG